MNEAILWARFAASAIGSSPFNTIDQTVAYAIRMADHMLEQFKQRWAFDTESHSWYKKENE
jgi:hypothetical protein